MFTRLVCGVVCSRCLPSIHILFYGGDCNFLTCNFVPLWRYVVILLLKYFGLLWLTTLLRFVILERKWCSRLSLPMLMKFSQIVKECFDLYQNGALNCEWIINGLYKFLHTGILWTFVNIVEITSSGWNLSWFIRSYFLFDLKPCRLVTV